MFRMKKRIQELEKELKEKEFEIQELEKMLDVDNLDMERLHKENKQKDEKIKDLEKELNSKDVKLLELGEKYHYLKKTTISFADYTRDIIDKLKRDNDSLESSIEKYRNESCYKLEA